MSDNCFVVVVVVVVVILEFGTFLISSKRQKKKATGSSQNHLIRNELRIGNALQSNIILLEKHVAIFVDGFWDTLPKTNIAPENRPSQKEISIPTIHFQVLCLFQGGYLSAKSLSIAHSSYRFSGLRSSPLQVVKEPRPGKSSYLCVGEFRLTKGVYHRSHSVDGGNPAPPGMYKAM